MSIAGLELVVRPPHGRLGWWGVVGFAVVAVGVLWWTALGAPGERGPSAGPVVWITSKLLMPMLER